MPESSILKRVAREGAGKPLLLVHGMEGPIVWDLVTGDLAQEFEVLVPTLPGFLPMDGKVDISDGMFVDFLELLRYALGVESWSLAGYSTGGRYVLNYALRYPQRVDKLIVCNTSGAENISPLYVLPGFRELATTYISKQLEDSRTGVKLVSQEFTRDNHPMLPAVGAYYGNVMAREGVRDNYAKTVTLGGKRDPNWPKQLPELGIPVQILWSQQDMTYPVSGGYTLNRLLPNSMLKVVEGFGHMAIMEVPEFYSLSILKFLTTA